MSDITLKRLAALIEIAQRRQEKSAQFGKTVAQKLVYLLQNAYRVDLGYRFNIYTYGPYSASLMGDIDYGAATNLLSVSYDESQGYSIFPGSDVEQLAEERMEFVNEVAEDLEKLFSDFGELNAAELELRSTIHYVSKGRTIRPKQKVVDQVNKIKPKFGKDVVERAYDELVEKCVIR